MICQRLCSQWGIELGLELMTLGSPSHFTAFHRQISAALYSGSWKLEEFMPLNIHAGGFSAELRSWTCWAAWWDEVSPNVLSPPFFCFPTQKHSRAQHGPSLFPSNPDESPCLGLGLRQPFQMIHSKAGRLLHDCLEYPM